MTLTYRCLAALLSYPDTCLRSAAGELRTVLMEESRVPGEFMPDLDGFFSMLQSRDEWEIEEAYVACFDTRRSTSLHLFEHIHGDSKDRGQAMVDLRAQYESVGLQLQPEELPDFLPAFLEYLSQIGERDAAEQLSDCAPVLRAIRDRLAKEQSPWAVLFGILLSFCAADSVQPALPIRVEKTIDEEWAEEPAFATPEGGVPACSAGEPRARNNALQTVPAYVAQPEEQ